MYLPTEHFLLADLPLVPVGGAAAGQEVVRCFVTAALCQTASVSGVSTDFRRTYTQHTILPRMCREPGQAEQTGLGQEKEGRCVEKVPSENPLISTVSALSSIGGQYVYIPNPENSPLSVYKLGGEHDC